MTIPLAAPARPLVRYHGGKWRMAQWIISHFPDHRIYTEAFGGGGSVLLRKPRSYAEVYNDLDGEIVNLFRVVRDQGTELQRLVEMTPFSREEFYQGYEASDNPLEQARRTMVRAGMGFGSSGTSCIHRTGFRGSARRTGTHPAMDWMRSAENLESVIARLKGVVIENTDVVELLKYHDGPETLHYVDPPYLESTRSFNHGKGAYRYELTEDDHVRLAECLNALRGSIILSGYHSPLYDELYSSWQRVEKAAQADFRADRVEVLWMRGNKRHPERF